MSIKKQLFTLSFPLFALVSFAQNQKGSLSGMVKTNDGIPAAFITVSLKNTNYVTQTDQKGSYLFKDLNPGTYILKISATGIAPKETEVSVMANQHTTSDLTINESFAKLEEVIVNGYRQANQQTPNLGKSGIQTKNLPQSVQIINTQVIQDQQANYLGDVIKNVNGVAMGANRGSVNENFYARGYSLGVNNVLKNGARTSIGGRLEASTLESVEVLKGSAALLYGGVTGGAVVNMVTKKPKFNYGGEVLFRTGSYDQYKPVVDIYGPITKNLAFRVIGTGEKAKSFRNHVNSKRLYVNPSLLYKISDKTDILLQGDYLKSNYTPDFGIGSVNNQIVDLGRDKFLNTPWAYNNTNTATAQVNLNHQFNDNWKLNVIGSFQSYNRNYFGAERIRADEQGISSRNLNRVKTEEYTGNQQINLTGKFNTGKIKHVILIGADADQSDVTSNSFAYNKNEDGTYNTSFDYGKVNVFDPSTYYGSGIMPNAFAYQKILTPVYRYGVFVQNLIEFIPQFKFLAGMRYTKQKNAAVTTTNLETNVSNATVNQLDDAFSPKLGLVFEPLKTTSFYVSYANNFIVNTGLDIYGAALKPSTVNQYEIGVKNNFWERKLAANVTYYKIINSNVAQQAEFKSDGTPNADSNVKQLNGQTTSDGLEIDLTGTLLPGLNFIAGYAYNFMRYTNTAPVTEHVIQAPTPKNPNETKTISTAGMIEGVRLVGTIKNTANATLFYTLQNGKAKGLKLGASAYYTGARNGGWNDKKNATKLRLIPLSSFTTIDLSAGYAWKNFSLLGKISNITNNLNYHVHENYSVNPIPPRQFQATIGYKF